MISARKSSFARGKAPFRREFTQATCWTRLFGRPLGSPGLVHFLAVTDEAAEGGASSGHDYPFFNRDLMSLAGQVSLAGMTLTRLLSDVLISA